MTGGNNIIKIIFFGDIVGKPGRYAVRDFLETSRDYDFVIANVENASHGFGLTEKNYNEFKTYGIHCMTCGNHIWDKRDIYTYIDSADCLIRPINYPKGTKGAGSRIFETPKGKVGVINVLGRVFMNIVDSQWEIAAREIERIKEITPVVIIDFHAEATAEKICFGKYCESLGVSAFFGTHTHVQTADEAIINGKANSLNRFLTAIPERYEVAKGNITQINAVEVDIDALTGCAVNIKRINFSKSNIEEEKVSEKED